MIRVLIVEDDVRIADLHCRFTMRVDSCEVVGVAHNLDDARIMIDALEPHLVLLDLYFPEGSGTDLLREIRLKGLETDVILITAAREVGPLKEAVRGGVFDYLIKPVSATRFHECLTKFSIYRSRISAGDALEQQDVDSMLHPSASAEPIGATAETETLPKGIDLLTLTKIRTALDSAAQDAGLSAEEVGTLVGVSRSTARRYLEYLTTSGNVVADQVYGTVGRPERKYFRTQPCDTGCIGADEQL